MGAGGGRDLSEWTVAVLGCNPWALLCLALDLALAKSLEALVHGFSLAALNTHIRHIKGPPHLLSVSDSSHVSALREVFENRAQMPWCFPNTLPALCWSDYKLFRIEIILPCASATGSQSILRPGSVCIILEKYLLVACDWQLVLGSQKHVCCCCFQTGWESHSHALNGLLLHPQCRD